MLTPSIYTHANSTATVRPEVAAQSQLFNVALIKAGARKIEKLGMVLRTIYDGRNI